MNEQARRAMVHELVKEGLGRDPEMFMALERVALGIITTLEPLIAEIERVAEERGRQAGIWEVDHLKHPLKWVTHICGCAERVPAFIFCAEHKKMLENPLRWTAAPVVYTTPETPTSEAERTAHESKEGSSPKEDGEARDRSSP